MRTLRSLPIGQFLDQQEGSDTRDHASPRGDSRTTSACSENWTGPHPLVYPLPRDCGENRTGDPYLRTRLMAEDFVTRDQHRADLAELRV